MTSFIGLSGEFTLHAATRILFAKPIRQPSGWPDQTWCPEVSLFLLPVPVLVTCWAHDCSLLHLIPGARACTHTYTHARLGICLRGDGEG